MFIECSRLADLLVLTTLLLHASVRDPAAFHPDAHDMFQSLLSVSQVFQLSRI
jgi:hypothetical protein